MKAALPKPPPSLKEKRRSEHGSQFNAFRFQPRPVAAALTFDPASSHRPCLPATSGSVSKYMVRFQANWRPYIPPLSPVAPYLMSPSFFILFPPPPRSPPSRTNPSTRWFSVSGARYPPPTTSHRTPKFPISPSPATSSTQFSSTQGAR